MSHRYLRFPGGKLKAVTLSYDDGVSADLRLLEIMERYGIRGTLNVCTSFVGKEGRLDYRDLAERVLARGHEVAVHGATHMAAGAAPTTTALVREYYECRRDLEGALATVIRGMAYPNSGITLMHNGRTYPEIRALLEGIGIAYARTLGGDNNRYLLPTDLYAWMPTAHHKNPNLLAWATEFATMAEPPYCSARYPRLFYLWGHSYEFDRDNNWELLERFCDTVGGREDIYYATNIEIADYMMAYNAIIESVDGRTLCNPTARPLYFDLDNTLCELRPGETATFA